VTAARAIGPVYVFEDGNLSLLPCVPRPPPDRFSFDDFEERLDGGIVVTITFAALRHLEAMLTQDFLVVV